MERKILVKNKRGTSEKKPPGNHKSWIHFWWSKQPFIIPKCSDVSCNKLPEVGAHVIIDGEGGKEYIVGLCSKHNHVSNDEPFWVLKSDLVSVK